MWRDGGVVILFDVTLEAQEGASGRMAMLLRRTMQASRAEAGCVIYRFSADLDDARLFHLVELWECDADLQAHVGGAAFRHFVAALAGCGKVVSSVAREGELAAYSRCPVAS
jgi:quinol monooxygenase YgiN